MVSTTKFHPRLSMILLVFVILHEGLPLDIIGKPANQSSTYKDWTADRAVDGNTATTAHTGVCSGYEWWMVDLEGIYCLTQITIVNRGDCCGERLTGAIVRAGVNSDQSQNTQIGDPVTSTQATDGAVIDFHANPTVSARYVSVESYRNCLQLAEVMVTTETTSSTIDLTCKPVSQSSTYVDSRMEWSANRAVDGNPDTASHTECPSVQWWKIDLQEIYSLTKITIVNRRDCCGERLAGAIVRAGVNSAHTQNTQIGGNVTSSQASNGAMIDFLANPNVSAQYVSVELYGSQCLQLAEVTIATETNGSRIDLTGKPVSQSSTYVDSSMEWSANRAVDGNPDTASHTECPSVQWWKVDLQAMYCLTKITIVNRGDCCGERLEGAIVRAGVNSDQSQNTQIGDPVPSTQATNGSVIDFMANLTVSARYVSVELYGSKCLQLAEVMVATKANICSPTQRAVDSTNVTVTWSPLPCADHYDVDYALSHKDGCEQINSMMYMYDQHCTCRESQTTINGLMPNSQYVVQIKAYVNGAYGPPATTQITTTSVAPTGPPTMVTTETIGQRNLTFTWSPPSCGDRGGTITEYVYELSNPNTGWNTSAPISVEEVAINELLPFTNYTFRVTANNSVGNGPFSEAVTAKTLEAEPTVPLNVHIQSTDNVSVILRWSVPDPPQGIITHYNVRYWRNREMKPMEINANVTQLMLRVTNLDASTVYFFQVQAITSAGQGPWSEAINATTEIGVPGPVWNLNFTERTNTSVTLVWDPPLKPGGLITGYTVQQRILEKPYQPELSLPNTYEEEVVVSPNLSRTNLEPGTKYAFRVWAMNEMFTGAPSNVLALYTKPSAPPAPSQPTTYQEESTDSTVTISFAPLVSNNIYVSSYVIHVKKSASSSRLKREAFVPIRYEDSIDDYTAAEISKQNLTDKFVVGDNQTYGSYRNAPLQRGAEYQVRVGSVSKGSDDEIFVTYSMPINVTVMQYQPPPTTTPHSDVVPAVVSVLVIVVLGLLIGLVIYKRRRFLQAKEHSDVGVKEQETCIHLEKKVSAEVSEQPEEYSNDHINVKAVDHSCDGTSEKQPKPSPKPRQEASSPQATPSPEEPKPFTPVPSVRIEDLADYIDMKKLAGENGFKADYKTLPNLQLNPWTVASKPENKQKNRYLNIFAYDHSRIVLQPLEDDPHSDYINACYIDGFQEENKYIACQGPNKASLRDIWRMVWQLDVDKIIMLTNPVENGKTKCMQYWDDTGPVTYADMIVTTVKEEVFLDYTLRDFYIHQIGSEDHSRLVRQYHYTTWPDMKPPEYPTPLLNFMRVVNAEQTPGRTVIHCSAGVGRTGTYIALDAMLKQMAQEGQVDVLGFIYQMRQKRIKMVQTSEQYKFIFDALLASFLTGDTVYNADVFRQKLSALKKSEGGAKETGMARQFEILGKLSVSPSVDSRKPKAAITPENLDKNRFQDLVPTDRARPFLRLKMHGDDNDYINANFLPGYRKANVYIGTQMPMLNTVADFWRLVYDHKATTIVMLNTLDPNDKTMSCYWPQEGRIEYGPLVIELNETTKYKSITKRSFTLYNKTSNLESEDSWVVTQFQYHDWPSDKAVPSSFDGMLTLLELSTQPCERTNAPVIVHCIDGYGATSVYCALMALLDQFKFEKAVNVFQAAHRLRMVSINMMYSEHHFAMCYDVLQDYLDCLASTYENCIW